MENTKEKIAKTEMIAAYLFLAIITAIMIACAWVVFLSWNCVIS